MHDQPVCKPVHRLLEQPVCMTFAARLAGVNCHNYVSDYCVGRHRSKSTKSSVSISLLYVLTYVMKPSIAEPISDHLKINFSPSNPKIRSWKGRPTAQPRSIRFPWWRTNAQSSQRDETFPPENRCRNSGSRMDRRSDGRRVDLRGFELMIDYLAFVVEMEINFAHAKIKRFRLTYWPETLLQICLVVRKKWSPPLKGPKGNLLWLCFDGWTSKHKLTNIFSNHSSI